jgi:hypothetical protein
VRDRRATWTAATVALLGALVTVFALLGLERADKLASTVGAVVGLAAVAVALFSARAPGPPEPPASDGQSVQNSDVGGHIMQIRDVRGDVRIGPDSPPAVRDDPEDRRAGR